METASSSGVLPGSCLGGRYRVLGELGRGGMGRVLDAFDERLGRPIAIKLLGPEWAAETPKRQRFLREARAAAMLASEYVVRVHDAGVFEEAGAYLAMERLVGKDLQKALRERGRFSPDEAVEILVQACRAVAVAHASGIIHRDLKPSNLFLVESSEGTRVKVLDFGISKITSDEEARDGDLHGSLTDTGSALGSPRYMSPEQVRDAKRVGPASDIWALGVIFYELLAGTAPFTADAAPGVFAQIVADAPRPLRELRPDVSAALEAVCTRCLEKRAEDRFRDVTALARALLDASALPRELEPAAFDTEATLDPVADPPARPAASKRTLAIGSLAAAGFAVFMPVMVSPRVLGGAPLVALTRPAVHLTVARSVASAGLGPASEPASRGDASPRPELASKPEARVPLATPPVARPVTPPPQALSSAAAPTPTTCNPPFVIDPATMTRRVKPGC